MYVKSLTTMIRIMFFLFSIILFCWAGPLESLKITIPIFRIIFWKPDVKVKVYKGFETTVHIYFHTPTLFFI